MAVITPPKYVKNVLFALSARNYPTYLVGGCVRDLILGVQPNDWDICTSALPEQVMEVFPGSKLTGGKHGTVTVASGSREVEVTTFRTEGAYNDHRHPDEIAFVGDLTEDLRRRDFTVNAIALSSTGLFIDPFGGRNDLKAGILRCVGIPVVRFEEDALRMFRALRFAARLGLQIEKDTLDAIYLKASYSEAVSAERVRDEIEKLILTGRPELFSIAVDSGMMDRFIISRSLTAEDLGFMTQLPAKALPRWAALAFTLEKQGCVSSSTDFLAALHIDSRTLRCCSDALEIIRGPRLKCTVDWKRCLSKYGVDAVVCASQYYDARYGGENAETVRAILKSGECFSASRLAVNGRDLLDMGYKGRALGEMLEFLLDYVIEHPDFNSRELLLSLITDSEEN